MWSDDGAVARRFGAAGMNGVNFGAGMREAKQSDVLKLNIIMERHSWARVKSNQNSALTEDPRYPLGK